MMRTELIRSGERYSLSDQYPKKNDENKTANETMPGSPTATASASQKLNDKQLDEIITKLNKTANIFELNIKYKMKFHEETNTPIVQIVKNDQVIAEMPPEKLLDALAKIEENLLGVVVDERV